jgi:protein TonB
MFRSTALSLAVHLLAYGLPYYFLVVRVPESVSVELDLSPMPQAARNFSRGFRPKTEAWSPARSMAAAQSAAAKAQADSDLACPPPCPDTPGAFVPAGLASSSPRWIEGFITDDDYPADARKLGIEGPVLLAVYIRADGSVRDVRLVKGLYQSLNETAISRVRASRFTPATDESGRPVPCKLILPIRFELR